MSGRPIFSSCTLFQADLLKYCPEDSWKAIALLTFALNELVAYTLVCLSSWIYFVPWFWGKWSNFCSCKKGGHSCVHHPKWFCRQNQSFTKCFCLQAKSLTNKSIYDITVPLCHGLVIYQVPLWINNIHKVTLQDPVTTSKVMVWNEVQDIVVGENRR